VNVLLLALACGGLTTFVPGKPACESGEVCTEDTSDPGPGPGPGPGPDDEDCGKIGDEDDNGAADCADPVCASVCDADGDGFTADTLGGDDCDDSDRRVNPDAPEICNGVDDDCDGDLDDDDGNLDVTSAPFWYRDFDQDGYGNDAAVLVACDADSDYSAVGGDCDDTSADFSPGIVDNNCDGEDNDCDPTTGDDPDLDGDGFGACTECDDGDGTINPGAEEVCGDGIDSNCDTLDCGAWVEDFESGTLVSPWSTAGNALWTSAITTAYSGSRAATSGNISHSQQSAMQITLNFSVSGSISFWHMESSESGYDYLNFYIDGVSQGAWSGSTAWSKATFPVSAGSHVMMWRYSKDSSVDAGLDLARVDYIEVTGGAP
jgi:hypothetical protein